MKGIGSDNAIRWSAGICWGGHNGETAQDDLGPTRVWPDASLAKHDRLAEPTAESVTDNARIDAEAFDVVRELMPRCR